MSAAGTIRLDSRDAVERALSARMYARVFLPRFQIASSALGGDASLELQRRVEKHADACGCGEGSAGALLALAGYVSYVFALGASVGWWGLTWRGLAAMLIGATVGKAFGVGRARVALYRTFVNLRDSLPVGDEGPAPATSHTTTASASADRQRGQDRVASAAGNHTRDQQVAHR